MCVYYCRTYDKAVCGGRGTVKDMCYEVVRRAEPEACQCRCGLVCPSRTGEREGYCGCSPKKKKRRSEHARGSGLVEDGIDGETLAVQAHDDGGLQPARCERRACNRRRKAGRCTDRSAALRRTQADLGRMGWGLRFRHCKKYIATTKLAGRRLPDQRF